MSSDQTQTTANELEKAKELIQAKRFEDARAILLTIDDPRADKWLERLNQINIDGQSSKAMSAPAQSFTTKLITSIVLLFVLIIPGVIAVNVFSKEAQEAQKMAGQKLPGADGLIMLRRFTYVFVAIFIVIILVFVGMAFYGTNSALQPYVYTLH